MDMRCRRSARSHVIFNLKLTLNLETCNMNNMTELMAHLMYSAEYIYIFSRSHLAMSSMSMHVYVCRRCRSCHRSRSICNLI